MLLERSPEILFYGCRDGMTRRIERQKDPLRFRDEIDRVVAWEGAVYGNLGGEEDACTGLGRGVAEECVSVREFCESLFIQVEESSILCVVSGRRVDL